MTGRSQERPVERLFPFVVRARILIVGRDKLARSKSRLHFVLLTHDVSAATRDAILRAFSHYPVVQHFSSEDLAVHFGVKGAKVVGFQKSGLAESIYAGLKEFRINRNPGSAAESAGADEFAPP